MDIAITAIGTATPPYKRRQTEVVSLLSEKLRLKPSETRRLKAIYKATGIETRYSVLCDGVPNQDKPKLFNESSNPFLPTTAQRMQIYKDHALALATAAVKQAFNTVEKNKMDITHLITVSCTGMYAPGIDIELVKTLGLSTTTKRTCVNFMGCYGAFNALKLAHSICQAESDASVLIVCVELCSIHFQHSFTRDNIISNAIFADGAAAAIVQANSKGAKYFTISGFHCDLLNNTENKMAWRISDTGFDIVLSSYIPEVISHGIASFAQRLFSQHSITQENVNFFAIHPGGIKILEACEKALNLSKDDNRFSYQVLREYGNMSSPTILFVLEKIWNKLQTSDNDKNILSCAFGPGLTLESMLLKAYHA